MKTFRYLIFILIVSGIFFGIYLQSDQKRFRRWRTSFKTTVIIAASLVGLVFENTDQ